MRSDVIQKHYRGAFWYSPQCCVYDPQKMIRSLGYPHQHSLPNKQSDLCHHTQSRLCFQRDRYIVQPTFDIHHRKYITISKLIKHRHLIVQQVESQQGICIQICEVRTHPIILPTLHSLNQHYISLPFCTLRPTQYTLTTKPFITFPHPLPFVWN